MEKRPGHFILSSFTALLIFKVAIKSLLSRGHWFNMYENAKLSMTVPLFLRRGKF